MTVLTVIWGLKTCLEPQEFFFLFSIFFFFFLDANVNFNYIGYNMQHQYQQYHLDKSATSMHQDSTPTAQKKAQTMVLTVIWVSICPLQVPRHHDCHKLPPSMTTRASKPCMYFLFYLFFIYTNVNFLLHRLQHHINMSRWQQSKNLWVIMMHAASMRPMTPASKKRPPWCAKSALKWQ